MSTKTAVGFFIYIGCVVIMSGFQCACDHSPKSPSQSYVLSSEKLEKLISEAKEGDANAAYRLRRHYDTLRDMETGFYWLTKAAENRHERAQYELGRTYLEATEKRDIDVEKAKYWLKKAAENGNTDAQKLLKEI